MPWITEQKIFIVEAHFRQKSIHAPQLQFKEQFRCREFPVHLMIYRWVNKFRTHGTVHNLNHKHTNRQSYCGRPKSSRTPHNVSAVRDSCCPQPKQVCASVKSGAWNQLGVDAENLIADLHMYPCRIQIKQKLTPDKMRKRVITHQWLCDKIDAVPDFLDNVWFSDEAHFLLPGQMNSKNNIFLGSIPLSTVCKGHYTEKCTAWVAISKNGIIGPFWFEDDNERSVTTNQQRYVQVHGKFWTALGCWRGVVSVLQCFQQDGATPHSSNESLAWLQ